MASKPTTVTLNKNKKGKDIQEYPKLVKTEKGKVRVNNEEEEAALETKNKAAGWKDK